MPDDFARARKLFSTSTMSPDRLARRGSFRSPILASRLAELGFPLKARDTRCVEMSPRLKTASTPGPTDDEISTSFETMWGRFVIGTSFPGLPWSGTTL